jgi:hypothetical protein
MAITLWLLAFPVIPFDHLPKATPAEDVARSIDRLLDEHWQRNKITSADRAGDSALYRRLMLDLTGRVPTLQEFDLFNADKSPDRYAKAVRKLLDGPEFPWYFGTVLDDMIQRQYSGDAAFVGYLRTALKANKRWDGIFRDVMLGPWDSPERKPAIGFLAPRAKDIDQLTADISRSFFGVDVSCARCHDHPLVKDWKREHYYGMAAFLVRTTGGKGAVSEKAEGEAKFSGKDGKERIVPMMFLSGKIVEDPGKPAPKGSKTGRRDKLVGIALEDRKFLSRAFVNRLWEYFMGRGLVDPVDQIHSGNPASIPELLSWLADDFSYGGYDIKRLINGITLSRAYTVDSRWNRSETIPEPGHFAVMKLRPLSPVQMASSLVIVLGDGKFEPKLASLEVLEKRGGELKPMLDPRKRDFQSSSGEALYLSNSESIRKLVFAGSNNLADRMASISDKRDMVKTAYQSVLGRAPSDSEATRVLNWLTNSKLPRKGACEDLAWVLATSAEFRFNH